MSLKVDTLPVKRKDKLLKSTSPINMQEAYRSLRTNLIYSLPGNLITRKIIITSTIAMEGKSITCANLAVSMASANKKVLIINCDLRNPQINKYFKIKNKNGLSDYLSGQTSINEILNATSIENLSVICSGICPPNPSELLASTRLKDLFDKFEGAYDYIFVDTPPVGIVSDSMILKPYSDGYLFIIRSGVTTKKMLKESVEKLSFADAKLLGVVLNGYNDNFQSKYKMYKN